MVVMATTVRLHTRPVPPRLLPRARYRYSTAVRRYINDDESTVLGTDVPFAGSRDTVGKKGSSRESVFRTRVLPGGRKKCCNDDESDVLVWQQLSDRTADTQHPPSPARPTTAGIGTGAAVRSCINDRHWTAGSRDTVRKGSSRVSILCIPVNKQQ